MTTTTHMPRPTTCEKMRYDGTPCHGRVVARVVPPPHDPTLARGWYACLRHTEGAEAQMRRAGQPDRYRYIQTIVKE